MVLWLRKTRAILVVLVVLGVPEVSPSSGQRQGAAGAKPQQENSHCWSSSRAQINQLSPVPAMAIPSSEKPIYPLAKLRHSELVALEFPLELVSWGDSPLSFSLLQSPGWDPGSFCAPGIPILGSRSSSSPRLFCCKSSPGLVSQQQLELMSVKWHRWPFPLPRACLGSLISNPRSLWWS